LQVKVRRIQIKIVTVILPQSVIRGCPKASILKARPKKFKNLSFIKKLTTEFPRLKGAKGGSPFKQRSIS